MANEVQLNGGESGFVPAVPQQPLPNSWLPLRPASLNEALLIAKVVADSDLAPKDYRNKPANVLVAFQLGAELGLAPMQSLQNIAVINGRPSIWGDAMLAIVQASGKLEEIKETDDGETATCLVKRRGWPEATVRTFSKKDATQAGLSGKDIWKSYDKRMRQMRARSFCLRDTFADVLKGVSMAEESMDIETTATIVPSPRETSPPVQPAEERKSTTEKLKEQLGAKTVSASPPATADTLLSQKEMQSIIILQKECGVDDETFKAYLAQEYKIHSRKDIPQTAIEAVMAWLRAHKWTLERTAMLTEAKISEEGYLYYLLKVIGVEKEDDLTPVQRASVLSAIETGYAAEWLLSHKQ